jgi:HTH-type transcriptional regulator / antitoxin HipB
MARSGPRRRGSEHLGPWTEFGSAVATRRLELGLTQRDLAELAEVSLATVQGLEAGRRAVRVDTLHQVLRALGWALVALPLTEARRTNGAVLIPVERPDEGEQRHD